MDSHRVREQYILLLLVKVGGCHLSLVCDSMLIADLYLRPVAPSLHLLVLSQDDRYNNDKQGERISKSIILLGQQR